MLGVGQGLPQGCDRRCITRAALEDITQDGAGISSVYRPRLIRRDQLVAAAFPFLLLVACELGCGTVPGAGSGTSGGRVNTKARFSAAPRVIAEYSQGRSSGPRRALVRRSATGRPVSSGPSGRTGCERDPADRRRGSDPAATKRPRSPRRPTGRSRRRSPSLRGTRSGSLRPTVARVRERRHWRPAELPETSAPGRPTTRPRPISGETGLPGVLPEGSVQDADRL